MNLSRQPCDAPPPLHCSLVLQGFQTMQAATSPRLAADSWPSLGKRGEEGVRPLLRAASTGQDRSWPSWVVLLYCQTEATCLAMPADEPGVWVTEATQ